MVMHFWSKMRNVCFSLKKWGPAAGGQRLWEGFRESTVNGRRWVLSGFSLIPINRLRSRPHVEPERLSGRIQLGASAPKPATEPIGYRASGLQRFRKDFLNSDFERCLRQFSGTRARQERPKRARAHEEGQNEPQEAPRARQERQERPRSGPGGPK